MAEVSSNSSALVVNEPQVEKYTSIFSVPPKTMFQPMSQRGGVKIPGNQFETGILSRARHSWSVTFRPNQITVQMYLQQRDKYTNMLYTLKPFCLELISGNQVKSRHEMHFQSAAGTVVNAIKLWQASWVNDGSWDETVDCVQVVVVASQELAGTPYVTTLRSDKSVPRKAALGSYTERDYEDCLLGAYLTDTTIICRGETFAAHKIVLSSHSPVFKKILSQDLETTITINDFDPEVIIVFLKFIYSGELDFIRESLCYSMFDVADIYQTDGLKALCEHQLTDRVTKENCMEHFQKSVALDAPLLQERSWETIKQNCKDLVIRNRENFKLFATKFPDRLYELAFIVGFL